MIRFSGRKSITALTLGGAATVAALLSPAVAAAGPLDSAGPLLNTDCSFQQVDAALHQEAPQMAAMLDSNPAMKNQLKAKFDLPVEQRRAELERYLAENPDAAQRAENDPQSAKMRETIKRVANTCHNF